MVSRERYVQYVFVAYSLDGNFALATVNLIQSFFDETSLGNIHQVHLIETFLPHEFYLTFSREIAPSILVLIKISHSKNIAQLRFYHLGHEVKNCGSGTLAAAAFIERSQPNFLGQLCSNAGSFNIKKRGDFLGLSIPLQKERWPNRVERNFWVKALGAAPEKLTFWGREKEYLIAEFSTPEIVKTLNPDFAALAKTLRASLIVTAKCEARAKEHYVMRYFAPQYGNPEDSATGSANFLLVQYWWPRLQQPWLICRQASKAGGYFIGRLVGVNVELYGLTRFL